MYPLAVNARETLLINLRLINKQHRVTFGDCIQADLICGEGMYQSLAKLTYILITSSLMNEKITKKHAGSSILVYPL